MSLSVITLDEAPILLQQVTVKKKNKPDFVWKGAKGEHKGFIFGQMGGSILREVALYIPNEDKLEGFLDEVAFYIVRFGQHKTPFRVHVYDVNGDMPGKELLSGNVILAGKRPNKYTTVDISSYNIPFGENGVFISMEWLNLNDKKYFYTIKHYNSKATDTYYGQQIGLSGEFEELYGRVRINNGPWKKMTAGFASPMFRAKISF
ncbi:hypothetical protein BLX24_18605 [Arsenicibacter rosenii]|uniref:Uncharacterized protein n=2 Tax=Arsenicibacter rosenii TaxID=1750698 RepID=A0A1S2VG96_9BACT|nr:hypothetical protein BLX24_18605 [Arsenicibacter rosenii]